MSFSFHSVGWVGALASGAAAVDPTSFANLYTWHKADALGLANNDPVSSWADSSGNGHTLSQGTGASQPTYKTSIINGKPVVRFDGSNDFMTYAADIAIGTGDFTIIAVMTAPAATDGQVMGYTSNIQFRVNRSGTQTISKFFGVSDQSSATFGSDSSVAGAKLWARNGASILWRENKTDRVNGVQNDGSSFSLDRVGKTSFGGNLNGDIAELIVYTAWLGDTDWGSLYDNYLQGKYGLP